jgi:hypothetical protein
MMRSSLELETTNVVSASFTSGVLVPKLFPVIVMVLFEKLTCAPVITSSAGIL